MGERLTDPDEVLFRQIHPSCIQNGEPASDRFKPQPNDQGFMSVDRSSLTTAQASFETYLKGGRQSAAVYGVSVGEFQDENIACQSDPIDGTDGREPNPAHALTDYTVHDERKWKNISKRLTHKAKARGRLHP